MFASALFLDCSNEFGDNGQHSMKLFLLPRTFSLKISLHFSALSKYNFEGMSLSVLPDEFKKNLKVPQKYSKKKPPSKDDEEFLSFIPGKDIKLYSTLFLLFFNFYFSFKAYFGSTTFEMH